MTAATAAARMPRDPLTAHAPTELERLTAERDGLLARLAELCEARDAARARHAELSRALGEAVAAGAESADIAERIRGVTIELEGYAEAMALVTARHAALLEPIADAHVRQANVAAAKAREAFDRAAEALEARAIVVAEELLTLWWEAQRAGGAANDAAARAFRTANGHWDVAAMHAARVFTGRFNLEGLDEALGALERVHQDGTTRVQQAAARDEQRLRLQVASGIRPDTDFTQRLASTVPAVAPATESATEAVH